MTHILIASANFYPEISYELIKGADAALHLHGATYDTVEVPGAFEIPGVIRLALDTGKYDGYIALGCVIRGETSHYDYVCGESARGLMDLAIQHKAAIGYGILTTENMEQAKVRAAVSNGNKGSDAAIACLKMIEHKNVILARIMSDNPNPSLQKKTAARLAAVQCIYQSSVSGNAPSATKQVAELKTQLKDNREEQKLLVGSAIEPNYPLLETILSGVEERREEIDQRLDGALNETWSRQRTGPLLVAILQCAIFEMFFGKEIKLNIIIDEYTRLTRRFFSDAEVNFVHGTLNTLVQAYG